MRIRMHIQRRLIIAEMKRRGRAAALDVDSRRRLHACSQTPLASQPSAAAALLRPSVPTSLSQPAASRITPWLWTLVQY